MLVLSREGWLKGGGGLFGELSCEEVGEGVMVWGGWVG